MTRAPGRLDVMGGIGDYSGCLVLQKPTAEACHVACQRHPLAKQKVWKHIQNRHKGHSKLAHSIACFSGVCWTFTSSLQRAYKWNVCAVWPFAELWRTAPFKFHLVSHLNVYFLSFRYIQSPQEAACKMSCSGKYPCVYSNIYALTTCLILDQPVRVLDYNFEWCLVTLMLLAGSDHDTH